MKAPGSNEGFHVLEEFTCEAISDTAPVLPGNTGRGVNPGMHVATELASWASRPSVSAQRIAELRKLSNLELLLLVRHSSAELNSRELLVIHDIASERLNDKSPVFEGAIELSREVMLVAVSRSA